MAAQNQPNINVIPAEEINKRFDRIEQKIDKLSDAMVSLARTEEKIMAMEAERTNLTERMNRHSQKLDDLNNKVIENTRTVSLINKITYAVVATVIGATITNFMMM